MEDKYLLKVIENGGCKMLLIDDEDIKEMEETKAGIEGLGVECELTTERNPVTHKVSLVLTVKK